MQTEVGWTEQPYPTVIGAYRREIPRAYNRFAGEMLSDGKRYPTGYIPDTPTGLPIVKFISARKATAFGRALNQRHCAAKSLGRKHMVGKREVFCFGFSGRAQKGNRPVFRIAPTGINRRVDTTRYDYVSILPAVFPTTRPAAAHVDSVGRKGPYLGS